MKMSGKITGFCLLGVAALAAAVGLSLVGCSEDSRSCWSPFPREVEATLPSLAVAEAVVVEPMGSRAACANDRVSEGADGLFTVSLGPEGGADAPRSRFVATRADMSLSNVWVLQFDASGATKACSYVGTVAAGQRVKAALQSGEGYTVWIVANGPAEGVFTTSNPATLADFESKMLYTVTPASDELIPLSGKLTNVRVLDNGQLLVGEDNTVAPEVTLTRAMAKVDLLLEYNVSGAELDGVWLYQVPVGACYGLNPESKGYPASGDASNFRYRNGESSGLAPVSSGSGTVTHTWYVGDNRRGQVPTILWEKNKGSNNAPAMATYARIKSHESANTTKGLYHDVFLGENVTTDFDVLRNRHYIYRVRIGGSLDDQKLLAQRDDRVWAGSLEYIDGAPTVDPSLDKEIHPDGQTFRILFKGYWTGTGIPVRATVGDDVLDEGVAVCYAGNTGEVTLEIPKNESADKREILFEYEWKGEWFPIGIGTQGGYGVTGGKVEPAGDIPGEGGEYSITLYGSFPAEGVKIYATSDGKSLMSGTVFKADTPVKLTVPANESYDARTVVFQYEWKGERFDIETRTQAAGYSFTNAAVTPAGDIPGEGKTYSLTLTGLLPSDGVEVRAQSGGTALVSGKVTASGQAVSLAVPGNMSYNTRTVVFEYLWNGTWTKIGDSRTQAGYSVTAATHNAPATIPGQGGSYNVTLTGYLPSNVAVRAQSGGTAIVSGTVTKSGTAVLLTVPGNLSYNNRSVTFEYNWNGTWTKIGDSRTQAGCSVTAATHNAPATIPGQGGSYNVTLTGVLPAAGVDVRASSGGTALVTGKVTASGTAVSLTIPGQLSYDTRTVTFEYNWNGTWTKIGADCTQQGWHVTNASVSPAGDIPGAGGTYTVTLTGWGGYQVRAMSGSTQLVINTDYTEVSNYSATLKIPANTSTGSTRSVTFQYRIKGTWTDIDTRTQSRDVQSVTWHACNTECASRGGIPTRDELTGYSWDGWPKTEVGAYWSSEVVPDSGGWYYYTINWNSTTQWYIADNRPYSNPAGCRCRND